MFNGMQSAQYPAERAAMSKSSDSTMSDETISGAETCDVRPTDARLVQIVDLALADAARRSGSHLACQPGCSQCCIGSFAINALDIQRLREGFLQLAQTDPDRAKRLKGRITAAILRNASTFPGDPRSGFLGKTTQLEAQFADYLNDEVCPVLDPTTRTCDLYASRPMTCRVFGPPVRSEIPGGESADALGFAVCELCFVNATPVEIASCEMVPDPGGMEQLLLAAMDADGRDIETTVSFAFAAWWNESPA